MGFYTTDARTAYEVTIYTDPLPGAPASGTAVAAVAGAEDYPGYHTVELAEPVMMLPGQTFSVVVRVTNRAGGYAYPVAVEKADTYEDPESCLNQRGTSFVSAVTADGSPAGWRDVWDTRTDAQNPAPDLRITAVCLKAYGSDLHDDVSFSHTNGLLQDGTTVSLKAPGASSITYTLQGQGPVTVQGSRADVTLRFGTAKALTLSATAAYPDGTVSAVNSHSYMMDVAYLQDLYLRDADAAAKDPYVFRSLAELSKIAPETGEMVYSIYSTADRFQLMANSGDTVAYQLDGESGWTLIDSMDGWSDVICCSKDSSETVVRLRLTGEGKLPLEIALIVSRNTVPDTYDLDAGTVTLKDGYSLKTSDGTMLNTGDSVLDYAGESCEVYYYGEPVASGEGLTLTSELPSLASLFPTRVPYAGTPSDETDLDSGANARWSYQNPAGQDLHTFGTAMSDREPDYAPGLTYYYWRPATDNTDPTFRCFAHLIQVTLPEAPDGRITLSSSQPDTLTLNRSGSYRSSLPDRAELRVDLPALPEAESAEWPWSSTELCGAYAVEYSLDGESWLEAAEQDDGSLLIRHLVPGEVNTVHLRTAAADFQKAAEDDCGITAGRWTGTEETVLTIETPEAVLLPAVFTLNGVVVDPMTTTIAVTEGENQTVSPDWSEIRSNFCADPADAESGVRTVSVTRDEDGLLTADVPYLSFAVAYGRTAATPRSASYVVRYYEGSTMVEQKTLRFDSFADVRFGELPVPTGYVLDESVNSADRIANRIDITSFSGRPITSADHQVVKVSVKPGVPVYETSCTVQENPDGTLYACGEDGSRDTDFTGLLWYDGAARYFICGTGASGFEGFVKHIDHNWYYVKNGRVDTSLTGLVLLDEYSTFYLTNGMANVNSSYKGLVKQTNGWFYFVNDGEVDFSKSGLVPDGNETFWYIYKGECDPASSYTGLVRHSNGWYYYINGGRLDESFTGLAPDADENFWYAQNGVCNTNSSAPVLVRHSDGNWYRVVNGKWDRAFSGPMTGADGKTHSLTGGVGA